MPRFLLNHLSVLLRGFQVIHTSHEATWIQVLELAGERMKNTRIKLTIKSKLSADESEYCWLADHSTTDEHPRSFSIR